MRLSSHASNRPVCLALKPATNAPSRSRFPIASSSTRAQAFRAAFAGFDAGSVASFTDTDRARLLADAGIVRHRGKIDAAINNARRALETAEEFGSLASYVWRFEPEPASRPDPLTHEIAMQLTTSPESIALSKDLKKRGWAFVGPTTMYAFMQAMGLINDHPDDCEFRAPAEEARARFVRPA